MDNLRVQDEHVKRKLIEKVKAKDDGKKQKDTAETKKNQ